MSFAASRWIVVTACALVACGGASDSSSKREVDAGPDASACTPWQLDAGVKHKLTVKGSFKSDDDAGVPFPTPNGEVLVARADFAGKSALWLTAPGGEMLANATPIEGGMTQINDDLSFEIETSASYADGPYELGVVVWLSGGDITEVPKPGDLASFQFGTPRACDPPLTGTSVRFVIDGDDATVSLSNSDFIRF